MNSTRGELQRVAVKTHFSVYFVHYFLFVDARNGVNSTRGELQRVVVKPGIQSCTGSVGVERFRVLALSALAVDLNIPGFAKSQHDSRFLLCSGLFCFGLFNILFSCFLTHATG